MTPKFLSVLLCALSPFAFSMLGADPTGTIAGTVLDPSGAAVGRRQSYCNGAGDRTYAPDGQRRRWRLHLSAVTCRTLLVVH